MKKQVVAAAKDRLLRQQFHSSETKMPTSIDWNTVIISAVAAILGAGGVTPLITNWLAAKRAETQDGRDFATATFTRMETRIIQLEEAEEAWQKEKDQLLMENGNLKGKLALLERSNTIGSVECDENGIITAWNKGAETIFGWTAQEIVGSKVEELISPISVAAHRSAFAEFIKAGATPRSRYRDGIGITKDGQPVSVSLTLSSWMIDGKMHLLANIQRRF